MSKISQYMFKKYLIGFILAISVLLSINSLVLFLSELKNLGNNYYDLSTLLQYIIMSVPQNFLDTLTYALLIGSMIAFGSMAYHSEIVAINSHGIGIKKTVLLILIQTFLLASIFSYIGNVFAPTFTSYAYEVKNSALLKSNSSKELWFKGQDSIVYAKNIITEKHLNEVEIYYIDNGIMTSTVSAKKAKYYDNNWNLFDVKIIDISNDKIINKQLLNISSREFIPFQIIKSLFNKKRHNSIQDLYENIVYFDEHGLYYEDHKVVFWQKVLLPFSCCIIVFISIPFLFTKVRVINQSQRLVYGILFGITYFVISSIIINVCLILTIPALISVLISMGVFILFGFFLFNKLVKSHIPI